MNKRIQFVVAFLFISFLLAGCKKDDASKYDYEFQGENTSWSASYMEEEGVALVEQEGEKDDDRWFNHTFKLEYKGDLSDLKNVKHMEIRYSTERGGGSQVADYDEDDAPTSKTFTLMGGSNSESYFDKDDVIRVEVNRDGNIENFELTLVSGK